MPRLVVYEPMTKGQRREALERTYTKILTKAQQLETSPADLNALTEAIFNIERIFQIMDDGKEG